uniref:Uncharacterized protein n=1 Tax=Arion vulgaris TaxID=1028688 RepID=A0A0B7BUA3_9EUPU
MSGLCSLAVRCPQPASKDFSSLSLFINENGPYLSTCTQGDCWKFNYRGIAQ